MINKLKIKFILVNMSLITIVLLITFITVFISTQQRLADEGLAVLQRTIREAYESEPFKRDVGPPKENSNFVPVPTFTVSLNSDNNIIRSKGALFDLSDQQALQEIVDRCLASNQSSGILPDAKLRFLKHDSPAGTDIAFMDRTMELEALTSLVSTSGLVGIGSMVAFFFISLFLATWALRPVETAWEKQKQFIADASHELKTPLSVILANTGIILAHKDQSVRDQVKWVEYIQEEAGRMNTLVENMLFLAKTDDMKSRVMLSRLNMSDVVWAAVLPFESVAFERHKTMVSHIADGVFIDGDACSLKQLVGILLDNACKYADDKGVITVNLSRSAEGKVSLSVNNTGNPIPPDQLEHVFERFFRVDKSRVRGQGGVGLGLAIAHNIAIMHHAHISIQSTAHHGTTVVIVFPHAAHSKTRAD